MYQRVAVLDALPHNDVVYVRCEVRAALPVLIALVGSFPHFSSSKGDARGHIVNKLPVVDRGLVDVEWYFRSYDVSFFPLQFNRSNNIQVCSNDLNLDFLFTPQSQPSSILCSTSWLSH
jgi:hypothetical protein